MTTPTPDPWSGTRDTDRPDTTPAEHLERWAAARANGPLPELDPRVYAPGSVPLQHQPIVVNVTGPQHARYVEPVNHVLHGLLTIFTSGLWAPVWLWKVRAHRKAMRRG